MPGSCVTFELSSGSCAAPVIPAHLGTIAAPCTGGRIPGCSRLQLLWAVCRSRYCADDHVTLLLCSRRTRQCAVPAEARVSALGNFQAAEGRSGGRAQGTGERLGSRCRIPGHSLLQSARNASAASASPRTAGGTRGRPQLCGSHGRDGPSFCEPGFHTRTQVWAQTSRRASQRTGTHAAELLILRPGVGLSVREAECRAGV